MGTAKNCKSAVQQSAEKFLKLNKFAARNLSLTQILIDMLVDTFEMQYLYF